ncbi:hypothetical protein [Mesorhizobium sp. LjRoot246]|uniref:hypothetical protein n=1 Tax=Mesorhizobium sp. LjRoot246 TaxID=3342294 RepID=UPI003ECCC64C
MNKVVEVRETGLKLLRAAGYSYERVGKGISYNVRINPDKLAHVKVGTKGGPIIRAQSLDAECDFNGLTDEITHLLYINSDRKTEEVTIYLIPKVDAVNAFRDAWKDRLVKSSGVPASDMVSIAFFDGKNDVDHGYQKKFSKYEIRSLNNEKFSVVMPLTIEEAKAGLAAKFGVSADAIKISIEM